jgi:hypothetical protein
MKTISAAIIVLAGAVWHIAAHFLPEPPSNAVAGTWFVQDYVRAGGITLSAIGLLAWLVCLPQKR